MKMVPSKQCHLASLLLVAALSASPTCLSAMALRSSWLVGLSSGCMRVVASAAQRQVQSLHGVQKLRCHKVSKSGAVHKHTCPNMRMVFSRKFD